MKKIYELSWYNGRKQAWEVVANFTTREDADEFEENLPAKIFVNEDIRCTCIKPIDEADVKTPRYIPIKGIG